MSTRSYNDIGRCASLNATHLTDPCTCSHAWSNASQELLPDAVPELREYLSYPLEDTLAGARVRGGSFNSRMNDFRCRSRKSRMLLLHLIG